MKYLLAILFLLISLPATMAFDAPQSSTELEVDDEGVPRPSLIEYEGVEYVKRYKYIMPLNGYAATIYRLSEIARIDSVYRHIITEANRRIAFYGEDYVSAAGLVQNIEEVKYIARRMLNKSWVKQLERRGLNVRVNIIANAQEEVLYLDISYISNDPEIDIQMIKLQEKLKRRVQFAVKGSVDVMRAQSDSLASKDDEKASIRKFQGYDYYYYFWVTNLSENSNRLYLSRGTSMAY